MKRLGAILVALFLSGCALIRHDAVVEGTFPADGSDAWAGAIVLPEGFAP